MGYPLNIFMGAKYVLVIKAALLCFILNGLVITFKILYKTSMKIFDRPSSNPLSKRQYQQLLHNFAAINSNSHYYYANFDNIYGQFSIFLRAYCSILPIFYLHCSTSKFIKIRLAIIVPLKATFVSLSRTLGWLQAILLSQDLGILI